MDKFIVKKIKFEDGVPLNSSIEKEDDPVASTKVVSKVVQENKQPTPILVRKYLLWQENSKDLSLKLNKIFQMWAQHIVLYTARP